MSEVTSRSSASRGRGSGRGGRGGFAGRGGRRPNGAEKPDHSDSPAAFDDDGDLGELRKLYGDKTSVIREMFPDWSEADVLFALQETNGDQSEAVTRIAEGTISQWGEVSKAKKPARTKAKDAAPAAAAATTEQTTAPLRAARGGRTVSEGGRGRGRATERGARGGAPRGRTAQPSTNGGPRHKENQQLSVPTGESSAWGETKSPADSVDMKPSTEQAASKSASAASAAKTWASMLRQSTTVDKPAPIPGYAKGKPADSAELAEAPEPVPAPVPAAEEKVKADEETTPVAAHADLIIEEPALPPPKDDLTETNLEQVIDDSQPAATGTAASTAADSWDPRQSPLSSSATPLSAAHQQHQRVPISGYAASALKATTDRTARPTGLQRRVLDQEESVRMPGNRELDRAAVQFGAFNLGGAEEDVDGEREDAETRAQPPADSPVAQPRTSLPPALAQPSAVPESFPKAAPPAPNGQIPTQPAQPAIPGQQYGRYGQDPTAQKSIDPFGQQATPVTQPPFDSFSTATTQAPSQAAFSSAPSDYSNYYTANQQDRNAYNNYYAQHYGQQQVPHGQHDTQQRPLGGYNAAQTDSLSQYPQSGVSHGQPRFGVAADSQNSGHSTPNPAAQAQQQIPQGQQVQPGQQAQAGAPGSQPQGHGQQYPGYNHPYYPYYQQYYSGYGQGNFGPYGGKAGMYGQPYGVSPNAPYDHASSPGNFAPANTHRENNTSSGPGDYGRGVTGQAGSQPGLAATGYGGSHESFARGGSAFQAQAQGFNSQNQPGAGASAGDDLKPFGDGKGGSGPSPSLGGARPGSATNTGPGQASGLPPQNSQMSGAYGGYPNHLQGHAAHGSGAYGMGASGAGANQHGNSPYGSYNNNQSFGTGGYYGAGQQQRGWGGNYH
ncbi:RNAPII degradation factor Def1, putative [Cordyceps militaris CM01]|uniref:RNA polymerase II degradation factor 1 n=1 Tax=Cordyceps militaris (strain CM01) TaxID=983644 RepID=G3JNY6_CORMM|nr:RNAPII degradation factor Def1, putative [Cordyceps militaris CM01]EGX89596.1 RNAPII degradation factor Def1, putative [Cordyceps militaris CM01]